MSQTDHEKSAAGFVPITQLRKSSADEGKELLDAVRNRLDSFTANLSDRERAALTALLSQGTRNPDLAALAAEPPTAVLAPEEAALFHQLLAEPAPQGSGGRLRPTLAVIMKATRICNLRCTYCRSWAEGPNQKMTFEVLARSIHGALSAPGVDSVEFVWHGGETTLRPVSFYRQALWLQQRFRRPGQKVSNTIQTNGTNLTAEWLDFLKRFRFGVGVSLDGPPEIHDRRRFDTRGRPTSHRVQDGLRKLQEHGIRHGVLMVVDDDVIDLGARRILDYFLELGVRHVSLLNVVPEGEPERALPGDYLEFPRFVTFLRELFQAWWPAHVDQISFREISDLADRLQGKPGSFCVFGENCMGGVLTIEPMGEISICDRYQGDNSYQLGNVRQTLLADLPATTGLEHARVATDEEMETASRCPWFDICQGGCPHDRYVRGHRAPGFNEKCCGWSSLLSDMTREMGIQRERLNPPGIPSGTAKGVVI